MSSIFLFLPAKIRLNFSFATVARPVRRRRVPENIFNIQSGASFDEEPNHVLIARPRGLMQRGRVGMAADRVVAVWIFARDRAAIA